MTKKDFELVAAAIRESRRLAGSGNLDRQNTIDQTVEELATKFSNENPRFDRERFIKACL